MNPIATEPSPASGTQSELLGTPASVGRATGRAHIVRGRFDEASVRPGDIVVCANVGSTRAVLKLASGVIVESGGVLSSAAVIAREYGIPAVLAVRGATASIRDGEVVTVDGASGIVTLGA